jgi:hypothetical protein
VVVIPVLALIWSHSIRDCIIRAAIEDDYAKRLSKLSKFVLGKDEVGYVMTF